MTLDGSVPIASNRTTACLPESDSRSSPRRRADLTTLGRMLSANQSGLLAATVVGGAALFQVGLAAGMGWGSAAWGGQHPGPLPKRLRVASAGSAVVLAGVAGLAACPDIGGQRRPILLRVAAGYFAVGTVANAASRSPVERFWAPVNAIAAVALWGATRAE
jgi:hypothetical protein